jgi:acyl-CoA thioester hydrolase
VTPTFSHQLDVRFRDCDPMGHVNNAVYLTYLEQARFFHWRALGLAGGEGDGASGGGGDAHPRDGVPGVILARIEIDYRRPATYGDRLEIRLGIESFGRTSCTYAYEILDAQGRTVATARSVVVSFDYAAGKPVPVPDSLREALSRNLL